jgi:hypothetical protein
MYFRRISLPIIFGITILFAISVDRAVGQPNNETCLLYIKSGFLCGRIHHIAPYKCKISEYPHKHNSSHCIYDNGGGVCKVVSLEFNSYLHLDRMTSRITGLYIQGREKNSKFEPICVSPR